MQGEQQKITSQHRVFEKIEPVVNVQPTQAVYLLVGTMFDLILQGEMLVIRE